MGRNATPFPDSPAQEIYDLLLKHSELSNTIPNKHAFWQQIVCVEAGYAITWGSFQYWWNKLEVAHLVEIDPKTKAIRAADIEVKVRERISS